MRTTLTVRVIDTYHGGSGLQQVPAPLHPFETPRALVRQADGSFGDVVYATQTSLGTYPFGLPAGQVYLAVGHHVVVDPAAVVDFGHAYTGRPGARLASVGTELVVEGTGMLPWTQDALDLWSSNVGALVTTFPDDDSQEGATVLPPTPVSWEDIGLLSAARGDEVWVLQRRWETPDSVLNCTYKHYPRAMRLTGIDQADATSVAAVGTFVESRSERLDLEVRLEELSDAMRAGAPGATFQGYDLKVRVARFGKPEDAMDVGSAELVTDGILELLHYEGANQVFALDYQNPLPACWPEVFHAAVFAQMPYTLPGIDGEHNAWFELRVVRPVAGGEAGPLRPLVGPPLALRAIVDAATGGLRVEWEPPQVGVADGYVVSLFELYAPDDYIVESEVARYHTVATSVAMLPDTVETGRHYYVRVTALAGDEIDVLAAPHHRGRGYGSAENVLGVITR